MPSGNSNNQQLVRRIEEARDALNDALKLLKSGGESLKAGKVSPGVPPASAGQLDYTMPMRAFVKKHSQGMNGAKKFVLLVAYLSKGSTSQTVSLSDVESQWNKMTGRGLLGMSFNRLYTSQARENDWASTEKAGTYRLRPSWKAIFNG
jgi:hypothetical protein